MEHQRPRNVGSRKVCRVSLQKRGRGIEQSVSAKGSWLEKHLSSLWEIVNLC